MKRPILKSFLWGCGTITVLVIALVVWIAASLFSGPGVMDMTECHPFRSQRAKTRYLARYEQKAQEWSVASETRVAATSYGRTFIRMSGPEDAPPLVFLPGGGSSSLIWLPIIENISKEYRTYAVDNIYDFVDEHVTDAYLGLRCFKLKQPPSPTVLRAEEWARIEVPLLFLMGQNEKMYSAGNAVQRIHTYAPQIETEIFPDCGHDLYIVQTEMVSDRILEFLGKE